MNENDKKIYSFALLLAGLITIGVSAGFPTAFGVFLCMFSHHIEKHVDNKDEQRLTA